MSRDKVDVENLELTGTNPTSESLAVQDEVLVVINQAYGPTGEELVGISDVNFDGFPALTLKVRVAGREGLVHLSPIHGDRRKSGMTDIEPGTKCELLCPSSGTPLERVGPVVEGGEADFFAIYLSKEKRGGSVVYVSDVWDHYASRVVDDDELISNWNPES